MPSGQSMAGQSMFRCPQGSGSAASVVTRASLVAAVERSNMLFIRLCVVIFLISCLLLLVLIEQLG